MRFTPDRSWFPWFPWRSATIAWVVAGLLVVAGVPPFVRMPPWCDITLYDLATRTILDGGTHYRDLFDTNLPGFIWILCGVRTCFGWSYEALRIFDLVIVSASVVLLGRMARHAGGTWASIGWMVAGTAGFYLFASEMCHAQRDVWMLLPVTAAVSLRLSRIGSGSRMQFPLTMLEGALWGSAVWLKPHVVPIAAVMWLVTIRRVAGESARPWRTAGLDLLGCVLGGGIVGAIGIGWMLATGTWGYFVDVFGKWNHYYTAAAWGKVEFWDRFYAEFNYFPMWSQAHAIGLVLAVVTILDGRIFRSRGGDETSGPVGRFTGGWIFSSAETDAERYRRGILAVLYLTWSVQATVMQRGYHYVHVPEVLLMFAVVASVRWSVPAFFLTLMLWNSLCYLATDTPFPRTGRFGDRSVKTGFKPELQVGHDALNPERTRWWSECFRTDLAPPQYMARRDGVGFERQFTSAIGWAELEECAEFLRKVDPPLQDGDLLCWHDTPHALYLMLHLRPTFRFMHVTTIADLHPQTLQWLSEEARVAAARARYAVSDLERVGAHYPGDRHDLIYEPGPDLLPPGLPEVARKVFPLDQPAVFRSRRGTGRYIVHRIDHPSTRFDIPGWEEPR